MNLRRPLVVALACLTLATAAAPAGAEVTETPVAAGDELHDLFERFFEEYLRLNPLLATYIGDHRYDDQLPNSIGDIYRVQLQEMNERYLAEAQAMDPAKLSQADRTSYDIFVRERLRARAAQQFPDHLLPLNQAGS